MKRTLFFYAVPWSVILRKTLFYGERNPDLISLHPKSIGQVNVLMGY